MRKDAPCIAWAKKLALRYEDLAPADHAALEAHVKICPACAAAQADYHFLDARLRALPPPVMKPLPRLSLYTLLEDASERKDVQVSSYGTSPHPSVTRPQMTHRNGPVKVFMKNSLPYIFVASFLLGALLLFGVRYTTARTALLSYGGHSDFVNALAWSPDGRAIASGSWDHTVQLWNANTGGHLLTYTGHNDIVDALAWSPNGSYIASGSWDHTVQVWNAKTCKLLHIYGNQYGGEIVNAVAWSPDGQFLAAGSRDYAVQVWDVRTGTTFLTYMGHSNVVDAVAWSPDGRYIASGGRDDNVVEVWNAKTGERLLTYKGHTREVSVLAWSPDGTSIASGSWDHTVQVWNASTGFSLFVYKGHSDIVDALTWSPDGRRIASGGWDHTVQIWRVPGT